MDIFNLKNSTFSLPVIDTNTGEVISNSSVAVFRLDDLRFSYLIVKAKENESELKMFAPGEIVFINEVCILVKPANSDNKPDLLLLLRDDFVKLIDRHVYDEKNTPLGIIVSVEVDAQTEKLISITVRNGDNIETYKSDSILRPETSLIISDNSGFFSDVDCSNEPMADSVFDVNSEDLPDVVAEIDDVSSNLPVNDDIENALENNIVTEPIADLEEEHFDIDIDLVRNISEDINIDLDKSFALKENYEDEQIEDQQTTEQDNVSDDYAINADINANAENVDDVVADDNPNDYVIDTDTNIEKLDILSVNADANDYEIDPEASIEKIDILPIDGNGNELKDITNPFEIINPVTENDATITENDDIITDNEKPADIHISDLANTKINIDNIDENVERADNKLNSVSVSHVSKNKKSKSFWKYMGSQMLAMLMFGGACSAMLLFNLF